MRYFCGTSDTSDKSDTSNTAISSDASRTSASGTRLSSYFFHNGNLSGGSHPGHNIWCQSQTAGVCRQNSEQGQRKIITEGREKESRDPETGIDKCKTHINI